MKKKAIIAIATLLAFGQGAWADETPTPHFSGTINPGQENEQNGSESKPYLISSIEDLNHLAEDVNSGIVTYYEIDEITQIRKNEKKGYADVYFKLNADLDYSTVSLFDSDEDGNADSNFTPIGMGEELGPVDKPFMGFFDGNNKTIKNITYTDNTGVGVGLFGYIYGGEIINVTLIDCSFTGYYHVGGIVGNASGASTIENCHVESGVSVTAKSETKYDESQQLFYDYAYAGGIIGTCSSETVIVRGCTSAASVSGDEAIGGIAGWVYEGSLVGCTSSATVSGKKAIGGIVGRIEGSVKNASITNCFYTGESSNVSGTLDYGIIVGDKGNFSKINLTLFNDDDDDIKNATRLSYYDGIEDVDVTLSGRTLYKDGHWNTLCLPFDVSTGDEPLSGDGVSAMTLATSSSNLTDNTLTLEFSAPPVITAGTPFIIKWNTGSHLTGDLVFTDKTINKASNNTNVGDHVTFTGTYTPVPIGEDGDNTKLYLGGDDTLYYPNDDMTIGAFRAYFQLNGITAGEPQNQGGGGNLARNIVLNFADDATGIDATLMSSEKVNSEAWHSLDGRKLNSKPTQKGLYIYKGKKMVVK